MKPYEIRRHAKQFLVWRKARQGYSVPEIAQELNVSRTWVQKLCKAKGWPVSISHDPDAIFTNFIPVDRKIAHTQGA